MRARSLACAAGVLLLALQAFGAATAADESAAATPPAAEAPALPDGFYVTPPRPVPAPLVPDVRARGPQPNLPQQAPEGGCPYNGRKLDLVV